MTSTNAPYISHVYDDDNDDDGDDDDADADDDDDDDDDDDIYHANEILDGTDGILLIASFAIHAYPAASTTMLLYAWSKIVRCSI